MNSASPLIPQGSNLEQQSKARSSLKVKIFCALGVNVAVLLVLLMQGCKREQPATDPYSADLPPVYDGSNQPPVVTDYTQPIVTDTNVAVTPVTPGTTPGVTTPPVDQYSTPPVIPPVVTPPASTTEYTIQKGDTFSSLASKFKVSVNALVAANPGVDPARLQIGKKIQIPAPTATAPTAAAVVDASSGETVYTVKSGDSLSKIASQFRTSVTALKSANGLQTDRIKVGDKLKIPAK